MLRTMLLLIFGCVLTTSYSHPNKEVIGYYPGWRQWDRSFLVKPTTIDFNKFTIVNFAFLAPHPDGKISLYPDGSTDDLAILKGEKIWWPEGYKAGTSLSENAHKRGTKVLASIGGWSLSNDFPSIASAATSRDKFALECVRIIDEYNFDGIDIDWEYPGFADHNGSAADKENFTLLLKAIRKALQTHTTLTQKPYLLTACFSADPLKVQNIDIPAVANLLDFLNIMTYDFFGAWETTVNHNSPLYATVKGNKDFCLDAAFKLYLAKGAPAAKINLGVAFYGRTFQKATEMYGTHNSTSSYGDISTWPASTYEGIPPYHDILSKWNSIGAVRYWDDVAKVPWIKYNNGVISYDDEESIGLKAEYVQKNNGAGVIIWEMTGDYQTNGNTPLLNKLNTVFGNTNVTTLAKMSPESNFSISKTSKGFYFKSLGKIPQSLEIYGVAGNSIFKQTIFQSEMLIPYPKACIRNACYVRPLFVK